MKNKSWLGEQEIETVLLYIIQVYDKEIYSLFLLKSQRY